MAGNLPANLLDETGQMLQRVVHTHLPAEYWDDFAATLNRVDDAVRAGEEVVLRRELVQLRWMVDEPEPLPAYGAPPPVYGARPVVTRGGRGRASLRVTLALAALCVALVAIALLATQAAPTVTSPPGVPPTDGPGTSSLWIAGVLAALAVAVVAIAIVINILRKRRRVPPAPESAVAPRPLVEPPRLMPAPAQVREQANRTIMSLAAHGGRP
ncbi:hypothetical protein ACIA48_07940 [Mycobacterium sp. NPDC051804]|uniref:hypothetical protein n=1 Tax=Mycobacterium sp. NPDC051804 TaxID=3364295 RepID=UPI0037976381